MNLSRFIVHNVEVRPSKPALRFAGETITYAALWESIEQATGALTELGVQRRDRVAYFGYNHPDQLVLLFALARLGAMLVPLNLRLALPELRAALIDSGAKCLFVEPPFGERLATAAQEVGAMVLVATREESAGQRRPVALSAPVNSRRNIVATDADPVLLAYTSGTTGPPKAAVLTQSNLVWNAINSVQVHEMTSEDHVLAFLPMFHAGGLNVQVLPALYAGATVTILPRFDPAQVLTAIARVRPSLMFTVPSTLRTLVNHPQWMDTDLSSLDLIMTGGMNAPDSLIRACHARGVPVGQIYGCTETAPIALYLGRDDALAHVGSAGKPAPHVEVRLIGSEGRDAAAGETGEIWIRGPNVMREYWRNPEATQASFHDDWFKTGDIAVRDDAGFIRIRGRSKELIMTGGESIYPAELENALADCPEIAEAAVVGVEDAQLGQIPVACVVRKQGATLDEIHVRAALEGRLARQKHPRRIVFFEALPRSALGRVQKLALKEQLGTVG